MKTPIIYLLYGGVGEEREVSLVSGNAVLKELKSIEGIDLKFKQLDEHKLPEDLCKDEHVVLLVIHGEYGEDGQVQSELEELGVEYCGCDARSSRLCMDKIEAKAAIENAGVKVVPGINFDANTIPTVHKVIELLGEEIVAKPATQGSSVGLCTLSGRDQIDSFLVNFRDQGEWLLEKRVFGREFSIGVLNGGALGVVEIVVPEGRIYDYEQKYHRDDTRYECPANLSNEEADRVKRRAEKAFQACECRDYARVDFLRDQHGSWFCLEINTLPGMTPTSLLPKSASACGYGFRDLISELLAPAVERFNVRS